MYAIISDGGRQYKVEEGQILDLDFRDLKVGASLTFDRVLALNTGDETRFGGPLLSGATVMAEVIGPQNGPKLVVQKFRRRKNSKRCNGHRQLLTRVKIGKIGG